MKEQFEVFTHHSSLVYLDNAATVQKPRYVLDEVTYFLTHEYANIHRGTYPLALAAEAQRDRARHIVAQAICWNEDEVVFTSNATHSSNLVAQWCMYSWWIEEWDIIALGVFDHHANIAPWQLVAERTGAKIVYVWFNPLTRQYDWSLFSTIDIQRLKIVSLSHVSNVTGQVLDVSFVKELSKDCQMYFVLDASQSVPHFALDVKSLEADFVYFTGHKVGALTGIGVLRWKKEHLDRMTPSFVGGGAIDRVTLQTHTYQWAPDKFEPWTPNVMWAVSLRAAFERIAWLNKEATGTFREQLIWWYAYLARQEVSNIHYCCEMFTLLQDQWLLQVIGSLESEDRIWLFSRSLHDTSIHKLGWYLGEQDICIRTWAHCTHPFHAALGLESTARMSLWAYNDRWDLQKFFTTLSAWLQRDLHGHSS